MTGLVRTIPLETLARMEAALGTAADELSRAWLVLTQEATGDRPNGRTNKTLLDIATCMRSASLTATKMRKAARDIGRQS